MNTRLEERLSKWVELPEDDESDSDYGLIIDDSVTTAELLPLSTSPPSHLKPHSLSSPPPPPPRFNKAGSCTLIPSSTIMSPSALLPANLHSLNKQWLKAPGTTANMDILQRYVESADSENYDDLVLPEDEDMLDRQLAEWKTPCRNVDSCTEVTMSGATAVDLPLREYAARSGAASVIDSTPTLVAGLAGDVRRSLEDTEDWVLVAAGSAPGSANPEPTRKSTPRAAAKALGLGLVQPVRAALSNGSRHQQQQHQHQRLPSSSSLSKPWMADWQHPQSLSLSPALRAARKPILIKNAQRPAEPVVIGSMRYDPVSRTWVGNEEEGQRIASAIAESERQLYTTRQRSSTRSDRLIDTDKLARKISQRSGNPNVVPTLPEKVIVDASDHEPSWRGSPPAAAGGNRHASPRSPGALDTGKGRPALIPPSAAMMVPQTAGLCGRPKPIFDPQNLRWIDPNEDRNDPLSNPFWNITELPVEPMPLSTGAFKGRIRSASEAVGSSDPPNRTCFVLSEEQFETYQREGAEYESFARRWFPNTNAA
ncbi:hypothetical protein LPJ53_006468 [Coemansia erecta]|uniref:Uncharacterized protein n=1 Tax=Coemansia erecta TaxID=147472 RepID=A0A9W7XTR1_9FUNG|nr:hypothetical protein LPJ53_006468 [Coemansia erecta]